MNTKNIPHSFVFDHLVPLEVTLKYMFGMYFLYTEEKIILILRQGENYKDSNGVWVATSTEHHQSLKKDIPSLISIPGLSGQIKESEWQLIPVIAENFENDVINVCSMIVKKDPRIGRIPMAKRKQPGKK